MPLVRFEVRNEYGLGDPELYGVSLKKEDPRAILDGVAVAGLVGILRQLGDLAEFASDIFHELHEQVMVTSARGQKLLFRVQHLEATLPSFENAIRGQRSHIHFASVAGTDWHGDSKIKQSHLVARDLPQYMMDSYEECLESPRLYLLDKFDISGAGACQKRYSDPSYFKRVWATSELENDGKTQREKKGQKSKRRGSKMRTEEVQHGVSPSQQHSSMQSLAPSIDEKHVSAETTPLPEPASRSTSVGSKTWLNFAEQVLDTNSFGASNEHEHDRLPISDTHINESGRFASHGHDQPNGFGKHYGSFHCSVKDGSAHRSPSVTWDEKTEIQKSTSPVSCDDIVVDDTQYLESRHANTKVKKEPKTSLQGTLGTGEIVSSAHVAAPLSNINHFDGITSENENYMDALNTLESEAETDSECQTKREDKSSSNFSCSQRDPELVQMQEMASTSSILSGTLTTRASQFSETEDGSPHRHKSVSTESADSLQQPNSPGYASDYSVDREVSQDNALDKSKESCLQVVDDSQTSDAVSSSGTVQPRTTNISKDFNTQPVDVSSGPSARFWTNGGLLGLEPSKPPDFSVANASSSCHRAGSDHFGYDHSSSLGEAMLHDSKTEAGSLSNEFIAGNSNVITRTNGYGSALLNKMSLSGDQQFVGSDTGVLQVDPSEYYPFYLGNQLEGIPVNQNLQRIRATLSTKTDKFHGAVSTSVNAQNGSAIAVPKGADIPSVSNGNLQSSGAGQLSTDISSGLADIAHRILANSRQRKPSIASADNGNINAVIRKPPDASTIDQGQKEGSSSLVSEPRVLEKVTSTESITSRNSISSNSCTSGHSSPPLDHMEISFHPMNGLEISKLKLEFASSNFHESNNDMTFPSFQLLPGPNLPSEDNDSEIDDDSFDRSCPCTSDDHLSHSDSNSEFWERDDMSGEHHAMYNDVHQVSLSGSSVSSFRGFDQMSGIVPAVGCENSKLYLQNSNSLGLPDLDSFSSRSGRTFNGLLINPEGFATQSQNEQPPPPPLPPLQWRAAKTSYGRKEERGSTVAEIVEHFNVLQSNGFPVPKYQQQNIPRPPPLPETIACCVKKHVWQIPRGQTELNGVASGMEWNKRKESVHQFRNAAAQKINRQKEATNDDFNSKQLDGREELLHQIRNKTFNLRRTSTTKPSLVPASNTNINVTTILEKANAIRQAFVGSDDGGEDDNWSDG